MRFDMENSVASIPEWMKHPYETLKEQREGDELLSEEEAEGLFSTGAAIVAGLATRNLCKALWTRWRGSEPPVNPVADDVTWKDALTWAVGVGAAVGVARVLSRRGTVAARRRLK